jgi:hypothetical protein
MYIFDCNLKSVKASGFGDLHFAQKIESQVFVDDAIRRRKKCQRLFNEMTFSIIERSPVLEIGDKIKFFGSPEGSFGLLLKVPNFLVLDGKQHEPIGVFLAQVLRHFIHCGQCGHEFS